VRPSTQQPRLLADMLFLFYLMDAPAAELKRPQISFILKKLPSRLNYSNATNFKL
jgi:hypothetical protein